MNNIENKLALQTADINDKLLLELKGQNLSDLIRLFPTEYEPVLRYSSEKNLWFCSAHILDKHILRYVTYDCNEVPEYAVASCLFKILSFIKDNSDGLKG